MVVRRRFSETKIPRYETGDFCCVSMASRHQHGESDSANHGPIKELFCDLGQLIEVLLNERAPVGEIDNGYEWAATNSVPT
jgi:hypothetical protein